MKRREPSTAGLANVKAQRIKAILQQIHRQRGELSLEFLARLPADQARDYLGAFEGVGPKTVGCVLMFCFGMPVLPVDTHVHRLALRLGLVPPKTGAGAAHALLAPLVPEALVHPFHVLLIQHGRRVCHARSHGAETACCGGCAAGFEYVRSGLRLSFAQRMRHNDARTAPNVEGYRCSGPPSPSALSSRSPRSPARPRRSWSRRPPRAASTIAS